MSVLQFSRYVCASGVTWATDFVVFMALYSKCGVIAALAISRFAAGVVGFIAHRHCSFRSSAAISKSEVGGYVGLVIVNYLLSVILMTALALDAAWSLTAIAKILTEIFIFLANFMFLRRLFLPKEAGH